MYTYARTHSVLTSPRGSRPRRQRRVCVCVYRLCSRVRIVFPTVARALYLARCIISSSPRARGDQHHHRGEKARIYVHDICRRFPRSRCSLYRFHCVPGSEAFFPRGISTVAQRCKFRVSCFPAHERFHRNAFFFCTAVGCVDWTARAGQIYRYIGFVDDRVVYKTVSRKTSFVKPECVYLCCGTYMYNFTGKCSRWAAGGMEID